MEPFWILIFLLAVLFAGCLLAVWITGPEDEENARLRAELAALKSTLRLSLAAWEARQEMGRAVRESSNEPGQ